MPIPLINQSNPFIIRSDSEDEELKKRKILKGPEARLNQLRISPATYCNEPEGNPKTHITYILYDITHTCIYDS